MAPKARKKSPPSDPNGMFSGMVVFLIETAIQARRLQIWKQKLVQMGAQIEETFSKRVNHIFAADSNSLWQKMEGKSLKGFKGKVLNYQWLEDSLRIGEKASENLYIISSDTRGIIKSEVTEEKNHLGHINPNHLSTEDQHPQKKIKPSPEDSKTTGLEREDNVSVNASGSSRSPSSFGPEVASPSSDSLNTADSLSEASLLYSPPDLNRNITEIFGKLINIYRALGDDRRSFSYYKAIPVIEKLPFKIESGDQVKDLPGIGKSLQDHIQEIVNTGKLSKLEHFEKDEKVRTITLFGEVWGIGPATAVKLYEKGYRTLDDLKNEESLTNSQKLGLKYFDDIRTRIPRHEVQEMESLIQKVGEEILPGVVIVCGGSYRRGKASCGDMDIVITHPDATSPVNRETAAAAMTIALPPELAACITHKGGCENPNFHVDGVWDVALCVLPLFRVFSLVMALLRRVRGRLPAGSTTSDWGEEEAAGRAIRSGRGRGGGSHIGFLPKLVKGLKHMGFLREDLVFSVHSEEGTDSGVDTYFGLCTYPGRELRHRIDFKVYPRDIYAFGLIAWTGNDVLNRRLRLLAESKGFRLDDTGLFPATLGSGGKRGSKSSASLKFGSEKEVFDFLGFPWLEPNQRNL
ncbi:DNA polymerase lambda family protein [Striga asiatica]|uniref:DNA polymerase n=1 Tax=Striga asiatica TaxID=4170 RepID=A0A5A7PHG2_STRAF|nr:DNA polymerase lambda family protein [Striga asiatica]